MTLSRRTVVSTAASTLAFSGLVASAQAQSAGNAPKTNETYINEVHGYGPLREDPFKVCDLPEGFRYQVISQAGETMDDGMVVPHVYDGMACFDLGDGKVALVRNHELSPNHRNFGALGMHGRLLGKLDRSKVYDFETASGLPLMGSTTTQVYDLKARKTVAQYLSLIGSVTNCAGGATPWGSWLTCEENTVKAGQGVGKDHGYAFEVPAAHKGLVDPVPLKAMGRFKREAVAIDPRTGIVYMTEDTSDSAFYRFLPNDRRHLHKGGKLQALGLRDAPKGFITSNQKADQWAQGDWKDAVWIDLDHPESPDDDLRLRTYKAGGAVFARGEGIHWGKDELYFCCTSGGKAGAGQIMRYVPSAHEGQVGEKDAPGRLQLFVESRNTQVMDYADNLTIAPWGHLIICEDRYSDTLRNHLRGITPDGKVYTIARNVFRDNAEFAGATFSPDGQTLFVNVQFPGFTLAITGPWGQFRAA
ncbi:MAG: alkaline phosphatase PhoX [Asticcacaulis sp.]